MQFVDSTAFNTKVPSRLVSKLKDLGLKTLLDILTDCLQVVRVDDHTSSHCWPSAQEHHRAVSSAPSCIPSTLWSVPYLFLKDGKRNQCLPAHAAPELSDFQWRAGNYLRPLALPLEEFFKSSNCPTLFPVRVRSSASPYWLIWQLYSIICANLTAGLFFHLSLQP